MPIYYAHSGPSRNGRADPAQFQLLREHLRAVAEGSETSARKTGVAGLPDLARAAGWLHDLGKYRPEFQQLLFGGRKRGDPETYHKQAGAAHALEGKNLPLALVIAGHHGGLPDSHVLKDLKDRDVCPSGLPVRDQVRAIAEGEGIELAAPAAPAARGFRLELLTRVLFGCLVDADWADTAAHERKHKHPHLPPEPDAPPLDPAARLESLRGHLRGLAAGVAEPRVGAARREVLDACLAAAERPPGLFSLTVPTGGGKTLAALAFALKHAGRHDLRRVIYVAPYTTILEQNADAIRKSLGVAAEAADVFTHHSLAEPPGGDDQTGDPAATARRAENWDAPIVVTTNVQFFESLFANNPGRCRKLPNVARSVVILDECQSLPPGLVAPTCGMLKQLAAELGCTVVLCTATQPAFDHDLLADDERLGATEIAPPSLALFKRLKRVAVEWPKSPDDKLSWPEVAGLMLGAGRGQALCVVNTKRAARELFAELKLLDLPGVFHLSTGMCPQHRSEKFKAIRRQLKDGEPCYVVSTQLIEAGVDVDFPLVLREMAPLEAVIQAGGRCNREGRLRDAAGVAELGRLVVFRSVEGNLSPSKWYAAGRDTLSGDFLARGVEPRIDEPGDIRDYFGRLYYSQGDQALDAHGIREMRAKYQYRSVAEAYRLIDNPGEPVVVEEWAGHKAEIKSLLDEVDQRPTKAGFRALAKYQVNVLPSQAQQSGHLIGTRPSGVRTWSAKYDDDIGIVAELPDNFIS